MENIGLTKRIYNSLLLKQDVSTNKYHKSVIYVIDRTNSNKRRVNVMIITV